MASETKDGPTHHRSIWHSVGNRAVDIRACARAPRELPVTSASPSPRHATTWHKVDNRGADIPATTRARVDRTCKGAPRMASETKDGPTHRRSVRHKVDSRAVDIPACARAPGELPVTSASPSPRHRTSWHSVGNRGAGVPMGSRDTKAAGETSALISAEDPKACPAISVHRCHPLS